MSETEAMIGRCVCCNKEFSIFGRCVNNPIGEECNECHDFNNRAARFVRHYWDRDTKTWTWQEWKGKK